MKNKMVTYILIAVTILVWGIIIYRIFDGMDSENNTIYIAPVKANQPRNIEEEKDTFKLINNYRDPFLGNAVRNNFSENNINGSTKSTLPKKAIKSVEPVKQIDWSFLQYIGSVHNTDKKKKICLISVHGREYMIGEGEEISGITIIQKEKDSVYVKYEGVKKWIKRN